WEKAGSGATSMTSASSAMLAIRSGLSIHILFSFLLNILTRVPGHKSSCKWRGADQHPEGIGPPILHPQQNRNRKDENKPEKSPLFVPQMHEKQYGEPGLDASHNQHAPEHLRGIDMLIGNDELQAGQSQQANIDNQIFSDSAALLLLGCGHNILLPDSRISGRDSKGKLTEPRTSKPDQRSANKAPTPRCRRRCSGHRCSAGQPQSEQSRRRLRG